MMKAGVRAANHALALAVVIARKNSGLTGDLPRVVAAVLSALDQSAILGIHVADAK
jgi:hypothetical protein